MKTLVLQTNGALAARENMVNQVRFIAALVNCGNGLKCVLSF
jgi:hypothetical protein